MKYFNSFIKKIGSNKYVKIFMNFYIIVSFIFIIWMLFIDTNSYLFHSKLNSEIEELKIKKENLQQEIIKDQKFIDDLKDLDVLKGIDVLEELDFENLEDMDVQVKIIKKEVKNHED